MASNDDADGLLQSAVAFEAVAGTMYQIAVDGFNGNTGEIDLNLVLDSNQHPGDRLVGVISSTDMLTAGGTVDTLTDDGFVTLGTGPAGSLADGTNDGFVTLGTGPQGSLADGGGNTSIVFNASANEAHYAIAGSDADHLISGVVATGQTMGGVMAFS